MKLKFESFCNADKHLESEIRDLERDCNKSDNTHYSLFLENAYNVDRTIDYIYLLRNEGRLISLLILFFPEIKDIEVYGFTHPEYRKMGLFTQLIESTHQQLKPLGEYSHLYVCDPACHSGRTFLKQLGTELEETEYMMDLKKIDFNLQTKRRSEAGQSLVLRAVKKEDAQQIRNIYNYYVENTVITFEEVSVDLEEMEKRIEKITSTHPWYVLEVEGEIQAYAYGSPWRVKSAYRFSSELTVYVHKNSRGKGYGTKLYKHLVDNLTERGFHCLYGVIALPNEGSSALHGKLGFTKCGHFSQVGYKFEKWLDVGYWEKVVSV